MLPLLANPLGLWALLGVPVVLAIHFFQQNRRQAVVSTLFLLEPLAPESRRGRVWDRLRSSRPLWLQLLAVLLAVWLLIEPRWVRNESVQTVAIVLDSSASMAAFRQDAETAVTELFAENNGLAARTEWLLLVTDPRQPLLYRGPDRQAALARLADWLPALGTHEVKPALELAHTLAGVNGLTWFVTHSRGQVPEGQPAVGVGRQLANVGFTGASVRRGPEGLMWRALLTNPSDQPQTRTWWVEVDGKRTPPRTLTIAAGALLEVSGRWPDNVEHCVVMLEPDEFAPDDCLPLVRPVAKSLPVGLELTGEADAFFRQVLGTVEGVTVVAGLPSRLRVKRLDPDLPHPAGAAVLLPLEPPGTSSRARIQKAAVVVEKHPLTDNLNWQGWLGSGTNNFSCTPVDTPLLWQDRSPLVWLTAGDEENRHLVFNFDWEVSNAMRLPSMALLLRRFVEQVRDAQPGAYAANFDTLAPVRLAARELADSTPVISEFQAVGDSQPRVAQKIGPAALGSWRAPAQPGFFVLRRAEQVLVRGATQFADPRQSDFRLAETFATAVPSGVQALRQRNSRPDPFTAYWLVLFGLCLLGSWWPGGRNVMERESITGRTVRSKA